MNTTTPDDPAAFFAHVRQAGIRDVIVAIQDEWDLTDARGFGPVQRARLLAYRKGDLLACDVVGLSADDLAQHIRAAGLTPSFRSRNRS